MDMNKWNKFELEVGETNRKTLNMSKAEINLFEKD